jgi:hypothetical protein
MPISRRVARFNRSFANHIVGPVLTRLPGFGMVVHRGRRSGRQYRTPVKVFRRGDDYVITLPPARTGSATCSPPVGACWSPAVACCA